MIVVDSSAAIAIFRQEEDAGDYTRRIAADDDPVMSAGNLVETSIVLRGLKKIAPAKAERWLDEGCRHPHRAGNAGSSASGSLGSSAIRQGDRTQRRAEPW